MSNMIMLVVILFPIISAIIIPLLRRYSDRIRNIYTEAVVLINSVMVWAMLLNRPYEELMFFRFSEKLEVSLMLDGFGCLFVGLVSVLWPLAVLYSFEYMEHEERKPFFFMFYVMTYGVTLGIALSANLVTMYFFYELLTLVTVPLVVHTLTKEAVRATRTYIYYSMGGAAFAFIGMIFIMNYGTTLAFIPGGVIDSALVAEHQGFLEFIFVMSFCGFSVKAAMFPFCGWLPKAGVAPTPVTALLHAVAVVKAGAFACIRITYYSFGTELLRGTVAQKIIMTLAIITILYGSSRALKETHIKRRMAWSTVSNLSYILFAASLMTPLGMMAACAHIVCHAVMKICLFFCAGAVIEKTGKEYIFQLDGLARKMPKLFSVFTVGAFALMGVPGLCGFISKWEIAQAAFGLGTGLATAGVVALMVSALLTAAYMMTIFIRAYFPGKEFDYQALDGIKDPGLRMLVPLFVFVLLMLIIGLNAEPLLDSLWTIASVMV